MQDQTVHYRHPDGRIACASAHTGLTWTLNRDEATCEDCLNAPRHPRRRGWVVGGGVIAVVVLAIGARSLFLTPGSDEPELTQTEIDQTIVAREISDTLWAMEQTRTWPTRQIEAATKSAAATQAAQRRVAPSDLVAACQAIWEFVLYVQEGYEIDGFRPSEARELALIGVATRNSLRVSDLKACEVTLGTHGIFISDLTPSR